MLAPAALPAGLNRTAGSYASMGSATAGRSSRANAPMRARTADSDASGRDIPTRDAVRPKSAERAYCSFDIDGACKYALATRQCLGCIKFDPKGTGNYCDYCFKKRHPFHREGHAFRFLHQRPPSPPVVAMKTARAVEVANDTITMLGETREAVGTLRDDAKERLVHVSKGTAALDALLQRLAGNILQLRDDDYRQRQRAARLIQTCWRLRKGRKMRRSAVKLKWGKCFDPATGQFFYVNRQSGATQWEKPRFAGREIDVNDLPRVLASAWQPSGAALAIQNCWRNFRARENIRRLILSMYRTVTDKATGSKYYFNMVKRSAQYRRPFALRPGEEPPEYIKYEDDVVMRAATITVQKAWRRMWGVRLIRKLLCDTYERVQDPGSKAFYYYNKKTHESTWKKPLASVVGPHWDVPLARDLDDGKSHKPISRLSEAEAMHILKKSAKMWKARLELVRRILATYRRVLDLDYGAYYWWNRKTGASSWKMPRVVRRLRLARRVKVGEAKTEKEGPEKASEPEPEEDSEDEQEEEQQDAVVEPPADGAEGEATAKTVGAEGEARAQRTATTDSAGATATSTGDAVVTEGATETVDTSATAGEAPRRGRSDAKGDGAGDKDRFKSRSKSRGPKAVHVTKMDSLRMHYNRLRAYYANSLPGRVPRLPMDFREHGTYLWTLLEERIEGSTAPYVKGLQYAASPYLYPSSTLDIAVLTRPKPLKLMLKSSGSGLGGLFGKGKTKGQAEEAPAPDPEADDANLTELSKAPRMAELVEAGDPESLGVMDVGYWTKRLANGGDNLAFRAM